MSTPAPSTRATGTAGLHAVVDVRVASFHLDVDLAAGPGEVVAVLGPNGAGKTTLLRALAGLQPLHAGRVTVDGHSLEDPAAGHRLAPPDRHVGVVFQDQLLFPHLTALDNVAFGIRCRGVRRRVADERARAWLDRVGLGDRADARPGALSGGQAQRVALARALATDPALLLLDEPLSALDVDTRGVVRRELRRHLDAFPGPALVVTHEPLEAIALADRLVILEDGRVVQDATPDVIARRPRSAWAARLVGLNHYRGRVHGSSVTLGTGATLTLAAPVDAPGEVLLAIHPRAVALYSEQPSGSPRNVWEATVDALDIRQDHVRVHLDGPVPVVAQITAASLAELQVREGARLWVAVKATEIDHWPA